MAHHQCHHQEVSEGGRKGEGRKGGRRGKGGRDREGVSEGSVAGDKLQSGPPSMPPSGSEGGREEG